MMKYNQRSSLALACRSNEWSRNNDSQQEGKQNESTKTNSFRSRWACPSASLIGFLLGALIAGVALATILTLYLKKEGSTTITTTITTSTTTSKTTTTTVTTKTTATTKTKATTTSTTTTTTTSTETVTTTTSAFNVNLLTNGDAESGSCETGNNISSPTGWGFSGPVSQLSYNNTDNTSDFHDQTPSSPGPSDRGQCYFFGYESASTSMWQTVNFGSQISPLLIDSQLVKFNLSAWIGGIDSEDDSVVIYLTFIDSNNQIQGNTSSIGPVFATDRANDSSLIFQQTDGVVPVGARFLTVLVTITRFAGLQNNGDVDNIVIILYQ